MESTIIPRRNGRLEVAWRVYDAIWKINRSDLTTEQKRLLDAQRETAYKIYTMEEELAKFDKLQQPGGSVQQRPTKRKPLGMITHD